MALFDANQISRWEFRIKNSSGTLLAILNKAQKRKCAIGLSKAGEASFSYNLKDLYDLADTIGLTVRSLIGVGMNSLECVRRNDDGTTTTFFAGPIVSHEIEWDGLDSMISFNAMGWYWLLSLRFAGLDSDRVFTATDAGQIAWTLIDETQDLTNGDFGITQGNIEDSIDRTLTYTRKNLKDAIDELSDVDSGFDFDITPSSKAFNVYYPLKGSDKSDTIILRYPGLVVSSIKERRDSSILTNHVLTVGKGTGAQELNASVDETSSAVIFGRREKILSFKDIDNGTVLTDIGQAYVDLFSAVNPIYSVTLFGNTSNPDLNEYTTGDFVLLKIEDGLYPIEQSLRIFEIQVDIADNDMEVVSLVLGLI